MSAEYHMRNGSNATRHSSFSYDRDAMKYSYYSMYSAGIVIGTVVNLWILASILTSPEIRSRMRNKLICILLVNNLIKSVFLCSIDLAMLVNSFEYGLKQDCSLATFLRIIRFCIMWIENWYYLIFMTVYIASLVPLDPVKTIPASKMRLASIALLIGPWIFSVIVGPSVIVYYSHMRYGPMSKGCLIYTTKANKALQLFGITIPFFLKIVLLVVIIALYFRRKRQDRKPTAALVGSTPKVDNIWAYVVATVVCLLTRAPLIARYVGTLSFPTSLQWFIYVHAVWFLMETKVVFLPLCFILFRDIRARLKTWRPWHRPGSGIDLSVQYQKAEDEERGEHYLAQQC